MRMINKLADRLLSAVVPEITAGACCSLNGTKYTQECYCKGERVWFQHCQIGCTCKATCGACYNTGAQC
jgi:hypothetical protein